MIALALLILPLLQDSRPASTPAGQWPALSFKDKEAAKEAIFSLKRAQVAARVETLRGQLRAFGPGVAPMLLEALRKTEGDVRARIESLLDELTAAGDAALLSKEFASRDPVVRLYAMRRCASFGERSLLPKFEKLLADPDAEVAFAAALGCCRAGSFAAFDVFLKTADADWVARGASIRQALAGVRGPEAVARLASKLKSSDPREQTAALRLLAGAGPPDSAALAKPFLDSTDLRLKLEAVNALRGIVDQAAPLDRPSSFDLIEEVNRWKSRLAGR